MGQKEKSIEDNIDFVVAHLQKGGIPNAGELLTRLFEFDALICNDDRHTNNIALIMEDGEITRFAPIFCEPPIRKNKN